MNGKLKYEFGLLKEFRVRVTAQRKSYFLWAEVYSCGKGFSRVTVRVWFAVRLRFGFGFPSAK